jgi:acetylornithine deacetylase/succinyl-diaminopimelate desuccinylase-like protein
MGTKVMLDAVLKSIDDNLDASLDRLFQLLRIDSISTDPAYRASCQKAADWLVGELSGLGFAASARPTPGHPVVVGHSDHGGPHVLFYGHYDVQPVDPIALWDTPPFEPRIVDGPDGRKWIAARGAGDDKGQLMTFVEALRAWRKVTGAVPLNVTVLLEGEEESGSPSLKPFLEANRAELAADVAFICDTGMWDRTRPAVTTSLRGLVGEEVTIRAASRDLHSGMYGGAARNPIHVLAGILAEMHDATGRVTIPGFYDRVPETPAAIKKQWAELDFSEKTFLGDVGLSVPAGEAGRSVLEQIWARPTAEVNGIFGGYTQAGFKTVIPATASAKVSFRLVGAQDPAAISEAFHDFVRSRLPADCSATFTSHGGSPALQLPLDGPWLSRVETALADEWGKAPVLMGAGGSIPVVGDFSRILGLSSVMVGFGLDDDRIHSPNEKYDLTSFRGGIRSWARIIAALAG